MSSPSVILVEFKPILVEPKIASAIVFEVSFNTIPAPLEVVPILG